MLKANRLTAGQILRFKLEVQLQRAVCSTSCGRNPEVRPAHRASSVLFHPVGCIKQGQSQQPVQAYTYLTTTVTPKQPPTSSLSSEWLPLRTVSHKGMCSLVCHKIMSKSSLFAKAVSGFRDMDVKSTAATPVPSFLQQRKPRLWCSCNMMSAKQNPPKAQKKLWTRMSQSSEWAITNVIWLNLGVL